MKYLVTGAAGFIGMHVSKILLNRGDSVVGIDCFSDYYDVILKRNRLAELVNFKNFLFYDADICNLELLSQIFIKEKFDKVIHLAAQPGVRYSFVNPHTYINTNITGFLNILELCKDTTVNHLVYASSSSVYGHNNNLIQSENQITDTPASLYGATKKSNELMAYVYGKNYGLRTTGLRYFTVYGPWGRPDMSPWLFTEAILKGEPIDVFNNGNMKRDFTYIDDIADGTILIVDSVLDDLTKIFNIGSHSPVNLMDFINSLESQLGLKAQKNFMPIPRGDVVSTYADVSRLQEAFSFKPKTSLEDGVSRWVNWYLKYREKSTLTLKDVNK